MKLQINIEYNSGEQAIYVAQPPEFAKWEKQTGNIISQASEKIGMWDLMFLAYNAHKREFVGKPINHLKHGWKQLQTFKSVMQTQKPSSRKPK